MTDNRIPIDRVLAEASAIREDLNHLHPAGSAMIHTDPATGQQYVDAKNQWYLVGHLWGARDDRRNDRVTRADEDLHAKYATLRGMNTRAPGIVGAARKQQRMRTAVDSVLDALDELVDAKVDARRMSGDIARDIKNHTQLLRRDSERTCAGALRRIRGLLGTAV